MTLYNNIGLSDYKIDPENPEIYILGCILSFPERNPEIFERIRTDFFLKDLNGIIFSVALDLYKKWTTPTLEMIVEQTKKKLTEDQKLSYLLEKYSIGSYIATIYNLIPSDFQLEYYLDRMNVLGIQRIAEREIYQYLQTTGKHHDTETVFTNLSATILNLAPTSGQNKILPISEIAEKSFTDLEWRISNPDVKNYIPTGFHNIDEIIKGFFPGDMITLAGRPSMGKTQLAINIVSNYQSLSRSSLVVSLEMTNFQIWTRSLAQRTGINSDNIEEGKLSGQDFSAILQATSKTKQEKTWLLDATDSDFIRIRSQIIQFAKVNPLDLIVIDYIQLLECRAMKGNNRQQEISFISRQIKALAKELNTRILITSQLSRECEKRADKRPMLSDLRESGSIEQDTDVAMFLYRDSYYTQDPSDHTTEILIRKNRNGRIGNAELLFFGANQRFVDKVGNYD